MVLCVKDHMNRREMLTGLGGVLAAGLAGCSGSASDSDSDVGEPAGDNPGGTVEVEIVEHEVVENDLGDAEARGLVENVGSIEIDLLEVDVVVYNAAGERIGDGYTNAPDVPPGEQVRFEAFTTADYGKVADYEIEAYTRVV